MRLVKSNNKWQTPSKEIKQINKQTNSVGNKDGKRRRAKKRQKNGQTKRRKRDQQQNKAGKYTHEERHYRSDVLLIQLQFTQPSRAIMQNAFQNNNKENHRVHQIER